MANEQKYWYAVYTAPRAEKKVSERFEKEGIEHYLPLQTVKRRWSDRIKDVVVPVIHGYIFVHIHPTETKNVLNVFGAIAFVKEFLKPVPIPEEQINRLKFMVDFSEEPIEFSMDAFQPGESVVIIRGSLQGLMGELVEIQGKHKVLVRLTSFGCALTMVPYSFLEKVEAAKAI